MKKIVLFIVGFLTIACSHETTIYTEQELTELKYNQAFEQTFGKISSSQTWGFSQILTRSAMPNSNEWGTANGAGYLDWPQPDEITDTELNKVLEVFNQIGAESYKPLVEWENFFVQQVYCGPNGSKMNELAATVDYEIKTNVISWWPYEATTERISRTPFDDIINNFNNGNCTSNGGCMLMWNSSTKDFSYKTSQSGGQRWYKHWRMEQIDGNYYVGFDHEAVRQADANDNEEDVRDYIYNDWIIKLIPGKSYSEDKIKESGRIICEDLGTVGDFDFNDVVFDATIYESGKTEITLLAAGGTLDISVDGVNVGEVLGKMVNTGLTKVNTYYFVSSNKYNNLIEIPIVVSKTNSAEEITSYELSAKRGKAPQKICVPKTFKWCKEYKSIKDAYPGFSDWVNNGNFWNGQVNESLLNM